MVDNYIFMLETFMILEMCVYVDFLIFQPELWITKSHFVIKDSKKLLFAAFRIHILSILIIKIVKILKPTRECEWFRVNYS